MEFEFGHLDIIQSENHAPAKALNPTLPKSIVLDELQKEIEEVQDKLKLNNRRLLLFETENNKLIEEKNKLFFEMKNILEKNTLLNERNYTLENETNSIQTKMALLTEKTDSLIQINNTQLSELKRFTKFHLKIQNVIKPYLQQLKANNAALTEDLSNAQKHNQQLLSHISEATQRFEEKEAQLSQRIAAVDQDKNGIISTYEEQIHSFSKEIIRLEQKNEDLSTEVSRLKKAVEFKNYFENELIKFKRIHEDDQREIIDLKNKVAQFEVRVLEYEQNKIIISEKLKSTDSELFHSNQVLETTREQLEKNITHVNVLNERLARLEKLNLNLSQQMHQTT